MLGDARAKRGDAFAAEVLAAYGREFDPAELERLDQGHTLYGTVWRRYVRHAADRRAAGPQ